MTIQKGRKYQTHDNEKENGSNASDKDQVRLDQRKKTENI